MRKRSMALALAGILCLLGALAAAEGRAGYSPTTGLPSDKPYRPVLVQISNSREARPIYGLADADIVYEAVYWGPGHTRYLALFNDVHPEVVGSLRSTRIYWNELRQMWDCPFVFYGWQGSMNDRHTLKRYYEENGVNENLLFDGMFRGLRGLSFRDKDRISPHNAMVYLARLVERQWPTDEAGKSFEAELPNLRFSDQPSRGEQAALAVDVAYAEDDYTARYVYDTSTRQYSRWYNGWRQKDAAGTEIIAANVIVQYMWLSYDEGVRSRPIIKTTGSGPMDAFIDGTHIRGTWVRDEMNDWMRYLDAEGQELTLLPGKTYVQIVPMEMSIAFEDEEGAVHTLSAEAAA